MLFNNPRSLSPTLHVNFIRTGITGGDCLWWKIGRDAQNTEEKPLIHTTVAGCVISKMTNILSKSVPKTRFETPFHFSNQADKFDKASLASEVSEESSRWSVKFHWILSLCVYTCIFYHLRNKSWWIAPWYAYFFCKRSVLLCHFFMIFCRATSRTNGRLGKHSSESAMASSSSSLLKRKGTKQEGSGSTMPKKQPLGRESPLLTLPDHLKMEVINELDPGKKLQSKLFCEDFAHIEQNLASWRDCKELLVIVGMGRSSGTNWRGKPMWIVPRSGQCGPWLSSLIWPSDSSLCPWLSL